MRVVVPAPVIVSVLPLAVPTVAGELVSVTGSPELALTGTVNGASPYLWAGIAPTRCDWNGTAQLARWPEANPKLPVMFVPAGDERVFLHQPGGPLLRDQIQRQLEDAFVKPCVVGSGGWLLPGTLQLAWDGDQVWLLTHQPEEDVQTWSRPGNSGYYDADARPPKWVASASGNPADADFEPAVYKQMRYPERIPLSQHGVDGHAWSRNHGGELQLLREQSQPWVPMVAWNSRIAIGIGSRLHIYYFNLQASYDLGRQIQRLFIARFAGRTGIGICLERGLYLHWLGSDDVLPLDDEILNPVATFTSDGKLVLFGDQRAAIYELGRRGKRECQPVDWGESAPVAVMATGRPTEFATLSRNGVVKVLVSER